MHIVILANMYFFLALLLGIDAPLSRSKQRKEYSVHVDTLLRNMNTALKSKSVIFVVMLDCCRFDLHNITFSTNEKMPPVALDLTPTPKGLMQSHPFGNDEDDDTDTDTTTSISPTTTLTSADAKLVNMFDFFRYPSNSEMFIIYACDPGTPSILSEGERNSHFTGKFLASAAKHPNVNIEHLMHLTSAQMLQYQQSVDDASWLQRPWYHSCLRHKLVLFE